MGEKDIHDTILTVPATNAVILVNISPFQFDSAVSRTKESQYSPKSPHLWHELLFLCHEAKRIRGTLYATDFKISHLPAETPECKPFLSSPTLQLESCPRICGLSSTKELLSMMRGIVSSDIWAVYQQFCVFVLHLIYLIYAVLSLLYTIFHTTPQSQMNSDNKHNLQRLCFIALLSWRNHFVAGWVTGERPLPVWDIGGDCCGEELA